MMMDEKELRKLKVVQLKDLLKEQDLSQIGKKEELVQRLCSHHNQQPEQTDQPTDASTPKLVEPPPQNDSGPTPSPPPPPPSPPPPPPDVEDSLPPPPPPPPPETEEPNHPSKRIKLDTPAQPNQNYENLPEQNHHLLDEQEEEEEDELQAGQTTMINSGGSDLYLDTVNRDMLDFDFERLCSVTLSNINIYACLVCGKYFQGRSKTSPAYAHSIGEDHHVMINLLSEKVYVLPDGYEVSDPSLDDIKYLLNPTFTPDLLKRLDSGTQGPSYDLHGTAYRPGFVGLNNIKANDYLNVIVHLLAHVPPLRDYFVCRSSDRSFENERASELVQRFGTLMRKIWNPRAFKAQVSPHEFGQEVATRSSRLFTLTHQADPIDFLGWLLNTLHRDLRGAKIKSKKPMIKKHTSVIDAAFRGTVKVEEQEIVTVPDSGEVGKRPQFDIDMQGRKVIESSFMFLTLDLPPPPVFQDSIQKNIIPQVNLSSLLMKYNGQTTVERNGILRRYRCKSLPPFIILHLKRFDSNNFVEEKNPTIVNFPTKGVDFSLICRKEKKKEEGKQFEVEEEEEEEIYDLLGNVTYSSTAGTVKEDSQWKVQVHTRNDQKNNQNKHKEEEEEVEEEEMEMEKTGKTEETEEKWYQIQDLIVEEINRQMVFLGESYIQIWEKRNRKKPNF